MPLYYFSVLKRNEDYLAVFENHNTQWELGHYYDQGYIMVMNVRAFNAISAIKIAKQNEESEIARLQVELSDLRQKYQKLQMEGRFNSFGRGPFRAHSRPNNTDPLEVLGFKELPSKNDLKKRYKTLCHKVHSDRGGNDFLMRLVKEAYERLSETI